jgi:hypothetical protein
MFPTEILYLRNFGITNIICNYIHSFAISSKIKINLGGGKVYGFGFLIEKII